MVCRKITERYQTKATAKKVLNDVTRSLTSATKKMTYESSDSGRSTLLQTLKANK